MMKLVIEAQDLVVLLMPLRSKKRPKMWVFFILYKLKLVGLLIFVQVL